jgi:CheY-like chemotaxis protein
MIWKIPRKYNAATIYSWELLHLDARDRRISKEARAYHMRILVAEDEEDIKSVYRMTLAGRGHEVFLTSDGEECVKVYRQMLQEYYHKEGEHDGRTPLSYFDVLILDYKMPKKDGLQVAKEILEINPEQRIIFASAYVKETLSESVKELKRLVELMQKPFSVSSLSDTVENTEAYGGLKMLMTTSRDIIEDLDNLSGDQIRELFEGLRRVQKFKGP